ncbi:MAG TPA: biotin transporter BioY [Gemmatimonadales bacterium]|nr:biotin transporter BioY [Gemmatimonadales bacterium]
MEQAVIGSRSSVLGFRIAALVGGAVLVAAAAQVSVPLPGTPVPMTLQPMAVLLVGGLLGARFGALSMILYLAMGAAGLPVFTPTVPLLGVARLFGPTGGYLLAYPVAAYVVGSFVNGRALRGRARLGSAPLEGAPHAEPGLSARVSQPDWRNVTLGVVAGLLLIHVGGLAQLAILTGNLSAAARFGTWPFLLGDLIKIAVLVPVLAKLTPSIRARL